MVGPMKEGMSENAKRPTRSGATGENFVLNASRVMWNCGIGFILDILSQ